MKKMNNRLKNVLKQHIIKNKRQYTIVLGVLVIGILIGVIYVNNMEHEKIESTSKYITDFIEKYKLVEKVDYWELFKTSFIQNCTIGLLIWFFRNNSNRTSSSIWINII